MTTMRDFTLVLMYLTAIAGFIYVLAALIVNASDRFMAKHETSIDVLLAEDKARERALAALERINPAPDPIPTVAVVTYDEWDRLIDSIQWDTDDDEETPS